MQGIMFSSRRRVLYRVGKSWRVWVLIILAGMFYLNIASLARSAENAIRRRNRDIPKKGEDQKVDIDENAEQLKEDDDDDDDGGERDYDDDEDEDYNEDGYGYEDDGVIFGDEDDEGDKTEPSEDKGVNKNKDVQGNSLTMLPKDDEKENIDGIGDNDGIAKGDNDGIVKVESEGNGDNDGIVKVESEGNEHSNGIVEGDNDGIVKVESEGNGDGDGIVKGDNWESDGIVKQGSEEIMKGDNEKIAKGDNDRIVKVESDSNGIVKGDSEGILNGDNDVKGDNEGIVKPDNDGNGDNNRKGDNIEIGDNDRILKPDSEGIGNIDGIGKQEIGGKSDSSNVIGKSDSNSPRQPNNLNEIGEELGDGVGDGDDDEGNSNDSEKNSDKNNILQEHHEESSDDLIYNGYYHLNEELQGKPVAKVILLTYQRAGSSFTGELLTSGGQAVYVYEPLFVWRKFLGPGADPKIEENSAKVLGDLLDCRPEVIMSWRRKGYPYFKRRGDWSKNWCANSPLRLVKTIRAREHFTHTWLANRPDIKVVHLVRDPRGVLNSVSRGGNLWSRNNKNAALQCEYMQKDMTLQDLGHSRYLRVRYEDLVDSPLKETQRILTFMSVDLTKNVMTYLDQHTGMLRKTHEEKERYLNTYRDASFKHDHWKERMDQQTMAGIERACSSLMTILKYKPMQPT